MDTARTFVSTGHTPSNHSLMSIRIGILLLIILLPVNIAWANTYKPGEILVKYRAGGKNAARAFYKQYWKAATVQQFKRNDIDRVKLPKNMTVTDALALYRQDPDVESAEPNYYRRAALIPNDPFLGEQWALHNTGQFVFDRTGSNDADMDALQAWNVSTGSTGVTVAVIDSGVNYDHPDLQANMLAGFDLLSNDADPMDQDGHGTFIAGIIAAAGNNGTGVAGVAWQVKILPLRFLNVHGGGFDSDLIDAIERADNAGADIVNCSFGGPGNNSLLETAMANSPALFVCSAGNDNADNDAVPVYPAGFDLPNIIAVAATDQDDAKTSFSNYGFASVDVGAPGKNILSTFTTRADHYNYDFDDNDLDGNNWVRNTNNGNWRTTNETSVSGAFSLTDSDGADYVDNADHYARSPAIDLSTETGALLQFKIRGISATGDLLYVEASVDDINWTNLVVNLFDNNPNPAYSKFTSGVSGDLDSGWYTATVDLGTYDGQGTVYFRFRFTSNADGDTAKGWFIDDVVVETNDSATYAYWDGTSFAAPMVAGIAALIKSEYPSLNSSQIKAAIENSVDPVPGLTNLVASGGRVNANGALRQAGTLSTSGGGGGGGGGGCFIDATGQACAPPQVQTGFAFFVQLSLLFSAVLLLWLVYARIKA